MGALAQMGLPFGSQDHVPAYPHWRGATAGTQGWSGVEMVRAMSLPTERGAKRVGSCGSARKRDGPGRPLERRGGGGDGVSSIGVLLSEDRARGGGVMVNGREHRAMENVCQYSSLGDESREEDWWRLTNRDHPR
jgi:hypothetical protein